MSIEIVCSGCGKKLRVGDESAGKLARCPNCETVFNVPEPRVAQTDSDPLAETGHYPPKQQTPPEWHVRTAGGQSYGPISQSELEGWVREGRIASDAQLRRSGDSQWQWASSVFPGLPGGSPHGANPYEAPARSPSPGVGPHQDHWQAHRGGLILAFGILGWAVCFPFGIAAFFMGGADLKEIDAGRMDPEGRGLTMAGYILGMVECIVLVVSIAISFLVLCGGLMVGF